jgi:hypothetical protein
VAGRAFGDTGHAPNAVILGIDAGVDPAEAAVRAEDLLTAVKAALPTLAEQIR